MGMSEPERARRVVVDRIKSSMVNGHAATGTTDEWMQASAELRAEAAQDLRAVVFQQALQHLLPWRVERGWMFEVLASDGYCIAKCITEDEAERIISAAEARMARASRSEAV